LVEAKTGHRRIGNLAWRWRAGRKVKDGTYWGADEVKKGIDFLGGAIKKLDGSLTQSWSPDRTTLDVEQNRQLGNQ